MPGWCCRTKPASPRDPRSSLSPQRSMWSRSCSADVSRPPSRGLTMRHAQLWLICLVLATAASPTRAQGRLKVVASFSILGDFVRNVGGARVEGATLVGPDGDVHVYAPAPADAKKIADARLVVINGLGLEGWLPRLVQSAGSK